MLKDFGPSPRDGSAHVFGRVGSGFVFTYKGTGYVVTNSHVVSDGAATVGSSLVISFARHGTRQTLQAVVVRRFEATDLAILAPAVALEPMPESVVGELAAVGSSVFTVGYTGLEPPLWISRGTVAKLAVFDAEKDRLGVPDRPTTKYPVAFLIDGLSISEGSSGSAVLDPAGILVGYVMAVVKTECRSVAISAASIAEAFSATFGAR